MMIKGSLYSLPSLKNQNILGKKIFKCLFNTHILFEDACSIDVYNDFHLVTFCIWRGGAQITKGNVQSLQEK